MYYFKKISLLNRKLRLIKQIGKLELKTIKLDKQKNKNYIKKMMLLNEKISFKRKEIDVIDENLQYLQNEKPAVKPKISNNSLNVGKNDSGAHIQFPDIFDK